MLKDSAHLAVPQIAVVVKAAVAAYDGVLNMAVLPNHHTIHQHRVDDLNAQHGIDSQLLRQIHFITLLHPS